MKIKGYKEINSEWIPIRTGKPIELPDDTTIINMTVWKDQLILCTTKGVYIMQQKKWWEFWK